ncbi:conserved hypothetical protein [Neospora caninum Liverpool]|uniref:Uncharacterized protein n=1 Tax=Neospora caninum (strain Liverpool) TaxID=572307 RepID=F0V9I8_NEOCL|nr:conserved hypothetical protein [Neospora caninum Liverpool]CBZ50413.1 conserved hypothetical protein [Neospora caninum Liverpool]|eukprot:XP_003880447.1 conserved hypothetical protein [Neospora caninum Liverpool]
MHQLGAAVSPFNASQQPDRGGTDGHPAEAEEERGGAGDRALPYGYATLDQLQGRWVRLALKSVLTRTRKRRKSESASPFSSVPFSSVPDADATDACQGAQNGTDRSPPRLTLLSDASLSNLAFLKAPRGDETLDTKPETESEEARADLQFEEESERREGRDKEHRSATGEMQEAAGGESDWKGTEKSGRGGEEGGAENASEGCARTAWPGVYVHPKCVRTVEKLERLLPRMAAHDVCLCLRYLADAELLEHPVSLGCIYTLRQKAEELSAREIGVLCGILNKPFFRRVSALLDRERRLSRHARENESPLHAAPLPFCSGPSHSSDSRDTRGGTLAYTTSQGDAAISGAKNGRGKGERTEETKETEEKESSGGGERTLEKTLHWRRGEEEESLGDMVGKRRTEESRATETERRRQLFEQLVEEKAQTLKKLTQLVRAKCHDLHHADDFCTVLWTFHAHGLLTPSLLATVRRLLLDRLREPRAAPGRSPFSRGSCGSVSPFLKSLLPRHVAGLVALFLRTGTLDRELFRALWGACLGDIPRAYFLPPPFSSVPRCDLSSGAPPTPGEASAWLLSEEMEETEKEKLRTRKARAVGLWLAARLQGKDLLRLTEGLHAVTGPPLTDTGINAGEGSSEETFWREEESCLAMALQVASARKHASLSGSALSTLLFLFAMLASQLPGVYVHPDLAFRTSTHFAWKTPQFSVAAQAQFLAALPALSSSLPPDPLLVSALASSLTASLLPLSESSPASAGLLPLLSLLWVAVASGLALCQRSSASHAVAAAAERVRKRHYLDLLRHLPPSLLTGSAASASSTLPLAASPSRLAASATHAEGADATALEASTARVKRSIPAGTDGASRGQMEQRGSIYVEFQGVSTPATVTPVSPEDSLAPLQTHPSHPFHACDSPLQFLDPPPMPSSFLRHAQAEQHLLALRDTLEVATEALTRSGTSPVSSWNGPLVPGDDARKSQSLRERGPASLSKETEPLSVLSQVVLWTQIAAASSSAQTSEKLVRGSLGCLRRLLGAPETVGALAGSCRAAATAVVGLKSPEIQVACGVRSRLLCLSALWQNFSALRYRDSGVVYPLVEAVDAVAEAAGAARQFTETLDVSPFAIKGAVPRSADEHVFTTIFVDIFLSACELQVFGLLADSTRNLIFQKALHSLPKLSPSSLLLLLQSALLLAAEAEAQASSRRSPQNPRGALLPAGQGPHALLAAFSGASPVALPARPGDVGTLAFAPASPVPLGRLTAAQVYGHLLPCVVYEASRRFQDGMYIPSAQHLPLLLLARRFLLSPYFSSLLSRPSPGRPHEHAEAAGPVLGFSGLPLVWGARERQSVRAFFKHLEWREAASAVDACVQSNRLPSALPLLYSPFPAFSPALPRSYSSACHASTPSELSRSANKDEQSEKSLSETGHVGDCLWVAHPVWSCRWVSAFANTFAMTASTSVKNGQDGEAQSRQRSCQAPAAAERLQRDCEADAAVEDTPQLPREGSARGSEHVRARLRYEWTETEGKRAKRAPAVTEDEVDLALAINSAVSGKSRTADRRSEGDGKTANRFVVLLAVDADGQQGEVLGRGSFSGDLTKDQSCLEVQNTPTTAAVLVPDSSARGSHGLAVYLGHCLLEGMQMDGVARWDDGREWGILFDKEEFW